MPTFLLMLKTLPHWSEIFNLVKNIGKNKKIEKSGIYLSRKFKNPEFCRSSFEFQFPWLFLGENCYQDFSLTRNVILDQCVEELAQGGKIVALVNVITIAIGLLGLG